MNISAFCSNGKVYVNCECISGISFKNAMLQVKSAILPVICAIFAKLQEYYAFFTVLNTSAAYRYRLPAHVIMSDLVGHPPV